MSLSSHSWFYNGIQFVNSVHVTILVQNVQKIIMPWINAKNLNSMIHKVINTCLLKKKSLQVQIQNMTPHNFTYEQTFIDVWSQS